MSLKTTLLVIWSLLSLATYAQESDLQAPHPQTDSLVAILDELYTSTEIDTFHHYLNDVIKTQNAKGRDRNCSFNLIAQKYYDKVTLEPNAITAFRKSLSSLSYNLRKCGQPVSKNLALLLQGHKPVQSIDTLDKYAWYIEFQIANHYCRLNDHNQGIYFYNKISPGLIARKDSIKLSRLLGSLGSAYEFTGEYDKGLSVMKKGLNLNDSPIALAANHNKISRLYLDGLDDGKKCLYHLNEFKKALEQIDPNKDSMYESRWIDYFSRKGKLSFHQGQLDSALSYSHRALWLINNKETNPDYRSKAKLLHQTASIHYATAELDSCHFYILYGLRTLNPNIQQWPLNDQEFYPENTFVDLLQLASELELEIYIDGGNKDHLQASKNLIEQALKIHEDLEQSLTFRSSIIASKNTTHHLIKLYLDIYYEFLITGQKDLINLRQILNKSKANYLLDIQERIKTISQLKPDQQKAINDLRDSLQSLVITPYKANEASGRYQRIFELKTQIQNLLPNKSEAGFDNPKKPYFEYVQGRKYYYVFSNATEHSLYRIGSIDTVEQLVSQYHRRISNHGDIDSFITISQKLYHALTKHQFEFEPTSAIIGDATLQRVAFDALVNDGTYLVHHHTFYYPAHVQLMSNHTSESHHSDNDLLLICPEYPDQTTDIMAMRTRGKPVHLPSAEEEMEQLINMDRSWKLNTIRSIDKEELIKQLQSSKRVHFSGHGTIENDTARLVFSNTKGELYTLTQHEVQDIHADIDQLFLNACQTGLGRIEPGEGASSIARSFMEGMGSNHVVYTLWNVHDEVASTFAQNIYKTNLNLSKVNLSKIKRDFIKNAPPEQQHPYYWAAYQQTQLETIKDNLSWKTFFVIFGIGILFLLFRVLRLYSSH